jgi:PEP-CTERM motif-containing protein
MKLSRMILVAMLVVLSSAIAKADSAPGDPTIKINKTGPGDPACPPTDSSYVCVDPDTNSYTNPFVVDATSIVNSFIDVSSNFVNSGGTSGTEDLTNFYLAILAPLGPPPEIYTCTSDIFSNSTNGCPQVAPPGNLVPPAGDYYFEYFLSDPNGTGLAPGDEATVSITPEPSSLLLFSVGLLALLGLGFRQKRSSAYQA